MLDSVISNQCIVTWYCDSPHFRCNLNFVGCMPLRPRPVLHVRSYCLAAFESEKFLSLESAPSFRLCVVVIALLIVYPTEQGTASPHDGLHLADHHYRSGIRDTTSGRPIAPQCQSGVHS